jgi:transposase
MAKRTDAKSRALREHGALNASPQDVSDPLFHDSAFFDPLDLVQVKYEMLRRVQADGHPAAQAARGFGFSRPTFYQTQKAFQNGGLPALVHKRPGPRKAHKLSEPVLQFVDQQKAQDPALRPSDLCHRVQERFHISIHPRSLERALQRRQKGGR